MSDWESVTKIGKNVRSGGGGDRQTVVRGKGALNAAMRSGTVVATEKKYGTANGARSTEGQRAAKLDNNHEGPEKLIPVSMELRHVLQRARQAHDPPLGQAELAKNARIPKSVVADIEAGKPQAPNHQAMVTQLENALGVYLRGKNAGQARPSRGANKQKEPTKNK